MFSLITFHIMAPSIYVILINSFLTGRMSAVSSESISWNRYAASLSCSDLFCQDSGIAAAILVIS
jgi:hypothetical protein